MAKRYEEIIRVMETDLDGSRPVEVAIRSIKGMGFQMSSSIVSALGLDPKTKLKELSDADRQRLEAAMLDPAKFGVPVWMVNRRKDMDTGADKHIVSTDLVFTQKADIGLMRKIRTWKGVRHELGQPVRGQSTRSSFRVSGTVVGVSRKAAREAAKPAEGAERPRGGKIESAPAAPAAGATAAKPGAPPAKAAAPAPKAAPAKEKK